MERHLESCWRVNFELLESRLEGCWRVTLRVVKIHFMSFDKSPQDFYEVCLRIVESLISLVINYLKDLIVFTIGTRVSN